MNSGIEIRELSTLEEFQRYLGGYYKDGAGSYYTKAYGYEGPGEGVGNRTYDIGTYDQPKGGWSSGFYPATKEVWQRAADAWEGYFRANAPQVVRHKYMVDEPYRDTAQYYPIIRERAGWLKQDPSYTGPGKDLNLYCSVRIDPALYGYVNFWGETVQSGYEEGDEIKHGYTLQKVAQRRALGEKVGIYNGTRPSWGQPEAIDGFETDNRVNPWIAWKYGVDEFFLWECGFYAEQPGVYEPNVWIDTGRQMRSHGAGHYVYPGEDKVYPGDSRGVHGPIVSIRMKNFRRGQQDYEYLWLAQRAGVSVGEIVNGVVPAAFDDYNGLTFVSQNQQPIWAQKGYVFERARRALAQALEQSGKVEVLPTGSVTVEPSALPAGGGKVKVTWWWKDATSAVIDHGIGSVGSSGSQEVDVAVTTTFRLQLRNAVGTVEAEATVQVAGGVGGSGGTNRLINGGFERGNGSWTFHTDGVGSFTVGPPGWGGSANGAHVTVTQAGTNVQLYQTDLRLEPQTEYQLSFAARSATGSDMDVAIHKHDTPYTSYGMGERRIDLTTEWTPHVLTFKTTTIASSVTDARLRFWFAPYAKPGDQYDIDSVMIVKAAEAHPPQKPIAQSPADFGLDQNFPNPFNPSTRISYTLPVETPIYVAVYDVLGRVVATIVNEFQRAGSYVTMWNAEGLPSGVYFLTMKAGTYVQTRKVLLLK